jgi:uncharacterized protein YozE (UPF0346 family)
MHFYDFIMELPKQQDPYVQKVTELIRQDANFPKHTSDPAQLAIYLYLILDEHHTTAYQKLLMLYQHIIKDHKFPKRTIAREDMFNDALNLIVCLQNNDSRYKYHSL